MADGEDAAAARRRSVVADYRKKLLNCRELESRVSTGASSALPFLHPSHSVGVYLGFVAIDFSVYGGFCNCVREISSEPLMSSSFLAVLLAMPLGYPVIWRLC